MRTLIGSLCVVTLAAGMASVADAQEQNWAQKMFSEQRHDFGNVARGADARAQIAVRNIYQETVRIVHVGTTCGCTAAKPDRDVLKTGETAQIEVVMNTVKFMRQKDSNVDVTLAFTDARGASVSKTVRVPISAYIRPDVVIEPGLVNFGNVDVGAGAETRVQISYSGRSTWHIRDVELNSEYLTAEILERQRQPGYNGDAQIKYDLVVRVKPDAPVGTIQQQAVLVTDDQSNPRVPVLVRATVAPDIVITPSRLNLGTDLVPGVDRKYTIVVKGSKPFAIEKIECSSPNECFKVRLNPEPKTVHVLPLTFTPPTKAGAFVEEFTVNVTGRSQPLVFTAEGSVVEDTQTTTAAKPVTTDN